jgi:glutaconyl-CoA/methylmalonyl-CoA decarboxylase subunit gamma
MKRRIHLKENGNDFWVTVERDGDELTVQRDNEVHTVSILEVERVDERVRKEGSPAPTPPPTPQARPAAPAAPAASAGAGGAVAPMTGVVKELLVSVGDSVEAGERLVIMEAMKMDIEVNAAKSGKIANILVGVGDSVREGQSLIEVE